MSKQTKKIFCRSKQLNKKLPTFSPLIRSDGQAKAFGAYAGNEIIDCL